MDPLAYDGTFWSGKHNGGLFNNLNHGSYIYCYQNPVSLIDPNGKQTESDWIDGGNLQEVVIVAGKKSGFSWSTFGQGLVKGLVVGIVAAVVVVAVIATGGAALAAVGAVMSASTVATLTTVATVAGSAMVTYSVGRATIEAVTHEDLSTGESLSAEQTSGNLGNVIGNIGGGLAGGAAATRIVSALTPASVVASEVTTLATEAEAAASTAQKLQAVADDAVATVGEGSGAVHGTKVHTEFGNNASKIEGVTKEVSYKDGIEVKYGTKGSVRADAVEGPVDKPTAVYDLKTGNAKLTKANIAKYEKHLPKGTPVNQIKPNK